MSSAGIYGTVIEGGRQVRACLLIGAGIPRLHHSDGCPVYLVTEHKRGAELTFHDHTKHNLAAYPSHWPGPGGRHPDRWVYAHHERLPFDGPVPLFDQE